MTCGIYKITRKDTGQCYIGQSYNIERRWREHCYNKKNSYIDNTIRKYGKENFDFQIICELEKDDDLLNAMEEYYIWKYNTYKDKNHYNLTPGGDFNPMNVPEIAAKISGENNPMKNSEVRAKISGENHPMYGKFGEEHQCFGHKRTQESKEKISKAVSKSLNTSGYYRVYKNNRKDYKQGFIWVYRYFKDGKRKSIYSVDIKKLEEKVRAKGLKWLKFDE